MASSTELTLPAARLRRSDVLPAYGPTAVITRPPIVSPDGSMVSAIITGQDNSSPRLIRVPVDQPVNVIRDPQPNPTKFVRSTRIAKSSQTPVAVLDLTHSESEIEPLGKDRYATLCIPHHVIRFHTSISTAEAQGSHPEVWCDPCAQTVRDRNHYRVYGQPGQATA